MDLADAEQLAREALPHSGELIYAAEDADGFLLTFAVDTLDRPMCLVDKRTRHADVGTVFSPATFDRIERMRVLVDTDPEDG